MEPIRLPRMDCGRVCREIGDFVLARVRRAKTAGCVIGLSGGVDSSTTAALIRRAFKRPEAQGLELVGYVLPTRLNREEDTRDAVAVAALLELRHEIIPLEKAVEGFRSTNPEAFAVPFHLGNLISRVRANVLSTKAATENKLVAGTGNRDEDFGIGYYTLFGDGAVHLSPIGGLSKRLVREMARFLNLPERIVRRVPTAGLEPEQTDFKDLGYDYDLVELVVEGFRQGIKNLSEHPQVRPLALAQIAAYRERYGSEKFADVAALVDDILRRHEAARGKLEILHPPSPEITLEY
ncbi:MAG: NAD(+) synthase [Desulfobacterales bacterium]